MKKLSGLNVPHVIQCTKDIRYICIYCKLEFFCEGSLYVHLTTLKHLGLPNLKFQINPEFQCNTCGSDISLTNVSKHACIEKAFRNYWEIVRFIDEFGPPNMCLLCRGLMFETPAHLNVHMLISHNWSDFDNDQKNKPSLQNPKLSGTIQCPICLTMFKTSDIFVLHCHVFDDHTPEIGITMLNSLSGFSRAKYGSINDLKQWIVKRIYSCHFPNFRVKRFPVNNAKHVNRLLPEFQSTFCSETFPSLFHLSSHLCTYHFVDDISKPNCNDFKLTTHQQRSEFEKRLYVVQQEIDLRKRTLLGKGIIIEKVPASRYCLECFRFYETNFQLQIHYMIFHLNMNWNICGICSYDCKQALGIKSSNLDEERGIGRSYSLLWNALWNHEKCHILFFQELVANPSIRITPDCLLDFPINLKRVLEPIEAFIDDSDQNSKDLEQPYIFSPQRVSAFMELGLRNVKIQTEYLINETLNERVS